MVWIIGFSLGRPENETDKKCRNGTKKKQNKTSKKRQKKKKMILFDMKKKKVKNG